MNDLTTYANIFLVFDNWQKINCREMYMKFPPAVDFQNHYRSSLYTACDGKLFTQESK